MGRKYEVISADGHVEVPADMWADRVPKKFKDKAPHLVTHYDGSEWWHMLDFERENLGNLVCDLDYDEFLPQSGRTYHLPDGSFRPGCGDSSQRLREQDEDGIDAEVLYPPIYGGPFFQPMASIDRDAYLAIIRAYNDFLAEEYCAVAPDRLIGNAMVPISGIDDAIAEITHARERGLISASLAMWPNGGIAYKPEDDRFFAASLDLGMRMSPHGSFGGAANDERLAAVTSGVGYHVSNCIAQLVYYGVFDRFPTLKFYFAETHAGWIPHMLNWLDELYERRLRFDEGVRLKVPPSEYVRARCRFSFIADRVAIKYRDHMSLDMLLWGSDFPHSVGTCPHSRDFLDEFFEGVPAAETRQVLVENPCSFFGLDPNADITPTPAL